LDGLDKVSKIIDQVSSVLNNHLKYINSTSESPNPQLTKRQRATTYNDINKLFVYLEMYYDIEWVKPDPYPDEYPSGNSFDLIVDILKLGSIITKFKYVSRNDSFLCMKS
jgi:hypothetical protein